MNKDLKETGDVIDGSSGDMSQERSGIYQDRVNGKLPMDRVKGHYQMRDDKMAQMKETFERKGGSSNRITDGIKSAVNEVIDIDKDGDTVFDDKNKDGNMVTRGLKAAGKFVKGFDDRAQPSNNISRR
jgi:hypothetical protein|tara:strand:+ start:1336 stop:1719 length:384 start_codon:yes stop_codon:yes gene_type:complete